MAANPILLLVDGTAVAYRAFYAIAELSMHDGRPTNALFGFIRMLQQLEHIWKPGYCAVVFDGGLPEERLALLPEYKAQREAMPDSLRGQFPLIEEFLACRGIPSIRVQGEEADDVLASMAKKAVEQSWDVLMATSDKDMFQTVSDRVGIVSPSKTGDRMGPQEVFVKTGVYPSLIVDWQALTGDTVDNIPGVPGIGPKTAAKLLGQFGSLDQLWSRLGEVDSVRIRSLLEAHKDAVQRNLAMMKLKTDLSGFPDWTAMKWMPADGARMNPFYEKMELHSFVEKGRDPLPRAGSEDRQQGRADRNKVKPAEIQQELFSFETHEPHV
ncbi:MAG: 5'-3' exonuclease H3TH domain-containing protein [Lentisphaerota bacterium]